MSNYDFIFHIHFIILITIYYKEIFRNIQKQTNSTSKKYV